MCYTDFLNMPITLSFANLPFEPVAGQVIYIESEYNVGINVFIRENYEWLCEEFANRGLAFCYLPLWMEEVVRYNAPYITKESLKGRWSNCSLAQYVVGGEVVKPSLVFTLDDYTADEHGNAEMQCVEIEDVDAELMHDALLQLIDEIDDAYNEDVPHHYSEEYVCLCKVYEKEETWSNDDEDDYNEECLLFRSGDEDDWATDDEPEEDETEKLKHGVIEMLNELKSRGVSLWFLKNYMPEKEKKLSRILIDENYRIFMLDYDNMEIVMPPLARSLFILFLRHSEGIRIKDMGDHYEELREIYSELNPRGSKDKNDRSIRDIVDPTKNSINEKLTYVRRAFVSCFKEELAEHYCITGTRGNARTITLDRDLVIWE